MAEARASVSIAAKYHNLQLRSVLDDVGNSVDDTWCNMLASGAVVDHVDVAIDLLLPETAAAEDCFLCAVEQLGQVLALGDDEALCGFYRHFGWTTPDEYFEVLGDSQVMIVDIDHNDLDDRLAIVLLAYQMASACLDRRRQHAANETSADGAPTRSDATASRCTLFLDVRTYEDEGCTMWRSARLAWRLNKLLRDRCGLFIGIICSDCSKFAETVRAYLGDHLEDVAFKALADDVIASFTAFDSVSLRSGLQSLWPSGSRVSMWVLGGICSAQAADLEHIVSVDNIRATVFEQAQPAWQSISFEDAPDDLQPVWNFPPHGHGDTGFGAEPSNVRSSSEPYPTTLANYLRFLRAYVGSPSTETRYVVPALARADGYLPAPPGQPMLRIHARPLTVLPGREYLIKSAVDEKRTARAFAGLLDAASARAHGTLYPELVSSTAHDWGDERPSMAHMLQHGTKMPDAIVVALAARPPSTFASTPKLRRCSTRDGQFSLGARPETVFGSQSHSSANSVIVGHPREMSVRIVVM